VTFVDPAIDWRPLDSLVPADENPKRHDIATIRRSLSTLGVVDIIATVDVRTDKMVGGHGRVEALRAMHADGEDPPVGVRDDDGQWTVPCYVGWRSENDDEVKAAIVALNHLTEVGGWDLSSLTSMLTDLPPSLLEVTGFTPGEYDDLFTAFNARPMGETLDGIAEPNPGDFLPVLRIRLHPDDERRWKAWRAMYDDDATAFTAAMIKLVP
jgi:hypothetical protein